MDLYQVELCAYTIKQVWEVSMYQDIYLVISFFSKSLLMAGHLRAHRVLVYVIMYVDLWEK